MGTNLHLQGAHKVMLYCLLARVPIAFSLLIFENMLGVKKHEGRAVPYGQLITRLLSKKGISLQDIPVLPGLKRHYDSTYFLDPRQPQQGGSDEEEEQAVEGRESEPEDVRAAPPTSARGWEAMQMGITSIQSTLDEHGRRMDGFGHVIERRGHQMHAMGRFLKKLGKNFGISSSKGMNRLL